MSASEQSESGVWLSTLDPISGKTRDRKCSLLTLPFSSNKLLCTDWLFGHRVINLRLVVVFYEYHVLSTINTFRSFSSFNHLTVVFIHPSGRTYYYNRETKETTWTKVCCTTMSTIVFIREWSSTETCTRYWAILFFTVPNSWALTTTDVWFLFWMRSGKESYRELNR